LAALSEAAKVDESVRDYLPRADRGDSGNWNEDATPAGNLDQHARNLGCARFTVCDKDVNDLANFVANWVKDAATRKAGNKKSRRAHNSTLDEP
jgi:hypothetical protein